MQEWIPTRTYYIDAPTQGVAPRGRGVVLKLPKALSCDALDSGVKVSIADKLDFLVHRAQPLPQPALAAALHRHQEEATRVAAARREQAFE